MSDILFNGVVQYLRENLSSEDVKSVHFNSDKTVSFVYHAGNKITLKNANNDIYVGYDVTESINSKKYGFLCNGDRVYFHLPLNDPETLPKLIVRLKTKNLMKLDDF